MVSRGLYCIWLNSDMLVLVWGVVYSSKGACEGLYKVLYGTLVKACIGSFYMLESDMLVLVWGVVYG